MAVKGICEVCGFADDSYRIEENGAVMKVCKFCHDGYLERMGISADAAETAPSDQTANIRLDDIPPDDKEEIARRLREEKKERSRVPTLNATQLDLVLEPSDDDRRVLSNVRRRQLRKERRAAVKGEQVAWADAEEESADEEEKEEEAMPVLKPAKRTSKPKPKPKAHVEKADAPGREVLRARIQSVIEALDGAEEILNESDEDKLRNKELETDETVAETNNSDTPETPETKEPQAEEKKEAEEPQAVAEKSYEPDEKADEITEAATEEKAQEPEAAEEEPAEENEEEPAERETEELAEAEPEREQAPEEAAEESQEEVADEAAETPEQAEEPPAETPEQAERAEEEADERKSEESPEEETEEQTEEKIAADEPTYKKEETEMEKRQATAKPDTRAERAAREREKIHAEANQTIDDERISITSPEVAISKDVRPKTNLDVAISEYTGGVKFFNAFKYVMHRATYSIFLAVVVLAVSTVMFVIDSWQHAVIDLGGGAGAIGIGFLLMWYLSHCYELDRRALLLRIRQQEILFDAMGDKCYRELRTKFTIIKALGWLLNKLAVLLPFVVVLGGNIAAVVVGLVMRGSFFWLFPVISAGASLAAVLVYYIIKFLADWIAYALDRERNQQIQQQTLLDMLAELRAANRGEEESEKDGEKGKRS